MSDLKSLDSYLLSKNYTANINLECQKEYQKTDKKKDEKKYMSKCMQEKNKKCDGKIIGAHAAIAAAQAMRSNKKMTTAEESQLNKAIEGAKIDCNSVLPDYPLGTNLETADGDNKQVLTEFVSPGFLKGVLSEEELNVILLSVQHKDQIKLQCKDNVKVADNGAINKCIIEIGNKCDAPIIAQNKKNKSDKKSSEEEKEARLQEAMVKADIICEGLLPKHQTHFANKNAGKGKNRPSTSTPPPSPNSNTPAPDPPAPAASGSGEVDFSKGYLTGKDLKNALVYETHKGAIKLQCKDDCQKSKKQNCVSECEKKKKEKCDGPIIAQNSKNTLDTITSKEVKIEDLKKAIKDAEIVCENQITDPKYKVHPTTQSSDPNKGGSDPNKGGSDPNKGGGGKQPTEAERLKTARANAKTAEQTAKEAAAKAATSAADAKTVASNAPNVAAAATAATEAQNQANIAKTAEGEAKEDVKAAQKANKASAAETAATKAAESAQKATAAAEEAAKQLELANQAVNPQKGDDTASDSASDSDSGSGASNDEDPKKTSRLLLYILAFVILAAAGGLMVYVALKNKSTPGSATTAASTNPFSK